MNIEKTCPKCNSTNIWDHPDTWKFDKFDYCPKCEWDITHNEYLPYSVDESGNLYDKLYFEIWGKVLFFEFADTSESEQLFQHFYFPELARINIHLNLENPTTTQSFSVHEQHVKALRYLLNKVLEEIEKNEDNKL